MAELMDVDGNAKKKKRHSMHINVGSYQYEELMELKELLGCKKVSQAVFKAVRLALKVKRKEMTLI